MPALFTAALIQNRGVSFDLVVLSGVRPLEPREAVVTYERICNGEPWSAVLAADPNLSEFFKEITRRWPDIDDPQSGPDCPWTSGLELSPAHAVFPISWSRVEDVPPVIIETALRYGLHVYDGQEDVVHSPGQVARAAQTPRPERICPRCGKPIEATELSAEIPGTDGVFHMGCLLNDWPPASRN